MKNEQQIEAIKRNAPRFLSVANQFNECWRKYFKIAMTHSDYLGLCNTGPRYAHSKLTKIAFDRAAKLNTDFGIKAETDIPSMGDVTRDFENPFNLDYANYMALQRDPARPFWDKAWIQFDETGKPYLIKDFDKKVEAVCQIPDTQYNKQIQKLQDQLKDVYQKVKELNLELIGKRGLLQLDDKGQPVANINIFQR